MSGLSYLCDYGSESENSDCEVKTKRIKLPPPDLSKVSAVVSCESHKDDPQLHGGRIRSFPHVRGNWATFVYVKYSDESLENLLEALEKRLLSHNKLWQRCENVHVSVSKTFVLNYHLIIPFTSALQKAVTAIDSFELGFSDIKVYCNEENTRTFIALQADHSSQKDLLNLTNTIDKVLVDFKLPTFYENSSFHMSLFWINGNRVSEANNILEELNVIVFKELEKSLKTDLIDRVNCKSGNKHYQYCLQRNGPVWLL